MIELSLSYVTVFIYSIIYHFIRHDGKFSVSNLKVFNNFFLTRKLRKILRTQLSFKIAIFISSLFIRIKFSHFLTTIIINTKILFI